MVAVPIFSSIPLYEREMKKIIFATCMLFTVTPSFAGEISLVKVRNQKFEIVKVINDKASLQLFERIWKTKRKVKSSVAPQWLYKIDIEGKGHGDRWLYDPGGYVQVLSKAKVPIYEIPTPDPFNQLIGTHNKGVVPDAAKGTAPHAP